VKVVLASVETRIGIHTSDRYHLLENTGTLTHLPIIPSPRNPKNARENVQRSSKVFKPSIHNIAQNRTWAKYCKNVALCVRLAWYCGKIYSRHLFSFIL